MKLRDWFTEEQAAEYLTLSPRRVRELAKLHNWETKLEKLDGRRQATRLIRFESLKDYAASLTAPTIDVGEPSSAVAKKEKTAPGPPAFLEAFLERLLSRIEAPRPAYQPYQFVSLSEGASHIRVSRSLLEKATERGLPFVWDGKPSRMRKMIRVADLETFSAAIVTREIASGAGN